MPGKAHTEMGRCSYSSLPEWQKTWWDFDLQAKETLDILKGIEFSSREEKIARYCVIPDMMGWQWPGEKYRRYKKYLLFEQRRVPHGPPDRDFSSMLITDEHDQYNFLQVLQYYISKFLQALKKREKEDSAIYAGILGHIIQDACFPSHGLPNKTFFEYYPPPAGTFPHWHSIIDDAPVAAKVCSPYSLGTSANEIAFRAWVDLENHFLWCKQHLAAIAEAIYENEIGALGKLLQRACDVGTKLLASIWYSCLCLASGKTDHEDAPGAEMSLVDMIPCFVHPGGKYAMIQKGASVVNGRLEPLYICENRGGKSIAVEVQRGLGMTSFVSAKYIVDTSIFNRFKARVSLSPKFKEDQDERTRIKFIIELSEGVNRNYSPDLNYGDTEKAAEVMVVPGRTEEIDVRLSNGCSTLIMSALPDICESDDWCPYPHITVDDPVLIIVEKGYRRIKRKD